MGFSDSSIDTFDLLALVLLRYFLICWFFSWMQLFFGNSDDFFYWYYRFICDVGKISTRFNVGLMLFLSCFVSYMLRVNMSINILAMVHHHEVEVVGDENVTAIVEPDVSTIVNYDKSAAIKSQLLIAMTIAMFRHHLQASSRHLIDQCK